MEGRRETTDFSDDWEILHHSADSPLSSGESLHGDEGGMGDETEGMIKADYFTVQGSGFYQGAGASESGDSVASEKPSWIDPGSDNARYGKDSGELWSDSGSDASEERKVGEFDGKKADEAVVFAVGGEIERDGERLGFGVKGEVDLYESVKREVGYRESGEKSRGSIFDGADSGVKGEISLYESVKSEIRKFEDEVTMDRDGVEDEAVRMKEEEEKENRGVNEEENKRRVVWWKVPLELVRYCVMKMSNPIWTFSVAAAVLGVVMLGRKLYRMKHKTRSLQLKVTVDDQKVSQFMSRAARLNEAFSVVRRVPVIRPVLPAPGVTPWPVMSMR